MTQDVVCAKNAHIQSANERKQIIKGLQLLSLCKQFQKIYAIRLLFYTNSV